MKDDVVLPLPELLPTVEILNFGPVIDPPFSDARSWREFVTPVETKVFVSEQVQPTLTVEGSQQAANWLSRLNASSANLKESATS